MVIASTFLAVLLRKLSNAYIYTPAASPQVRESQSSKGRRMPGYQEILIISAIVLGVIFIPRMMEQKRPAPRLVRPRVRLSGRRRLAMALSLIYPLIVAGVMQPWRRDAFTYAYVGLGPVALGWLMYWVFQGFKRR
jgi:hypothetical protein